MRRECPTLAEILRWSATVDVPKGGSAWGLSRSSSYEAVKNGTFPAKVIKVGGRYRVVTASIIRALSDEEKVA